MRCASSPLSMPPKALSIVVDRRPRDLTPTVYSNPLFSSTLPHTFVTFIDFDTSSPVLGFFQPSSPVVTFFLPAVGCALFYPLWVRSFTRCGSALLDSFHQDHSFVRFHPVCCLELCLLSGVAVCECVNLTRTHHLRSVAPWFVKGLR